VRQTDTLSRRLRALGVTDEDSCHRPRKRTQAKARRVERGTRAGKRAQRAGNPGGPWGPLEVLRPDGPPAIGLGFGPGKRRLGTPMVRPTTSGNAPPRRALITGTRRRRQHRLKRPEDAEALVGARAARRRRRSRVIRRSSSSSSSTQPSGASSPGAVARGAASPASVDEGPRRGRNRTFGEGSRPAPSEHAGAGPCVRRVRAGSQLRTVRGPRGSAGFLRKLPEKTRSGNPVVNHSHRFHGPMPDTVERAFSISPRMM